MKTIEPDQALIATVSKIFYTHDLAMTCCAENEGMEDEYDALAELFVNMVNSYVKSGEDLHLKNQDIKDLFSYYFGFKDMLDDLGVTDKALELIVGELNDLVARTWAD